MPWPSLPPTADMVETAWTGATSFGALVAAIGAGITTQNLQAARRAHHRACTTAPVNRLHTMITMQAVRNETISVTTLVLLLGVLVLFVIIGIYAMLTPDPIREELRMVDLVTTLGLVLGALVVTVAVVMMMAGSILNRRDRHRMTNLVAGNLLAEMIAKRRAERKAKQP